MECNRKESGDEVYTPFYAVDPLLEFIPKSKVIWCPFDEEWSVFYQTFKNLGYKVIRSSLSENQDFFTYEPKEHYDIIISNPPFSKKDDVLKRLYSFNKPFAVLLPANSIQGKKRFKIFNNEIQMLGFDSRVDYHTNDNFKTTTKGTPFASAYFCRNLLPEKLILRELNKYEKCIEN